MSSQLKYYYRNKKDIQKGKKEVKIEPKISDKTYKKSKKPVENVKDVTENVKNLPSKSKIILYVSIFIGVVGIIMIINYVRDKKTTNESDIGFNIINQSEMR